MIHPELCPGDPPTDGITKENRGKPDSQERVTRGFAIAGIVKQYDGFRVLGLIDLYSRKRSSVVLNYDTDDWELLVIVDTPKQWQHYLESAENNVLIRCDHKNLEFFQSSKLLSRSRARWSEMLSAYHFGIEHL